MYSKQELLDLIGARAQARRLALGLRQVDLVSATGVTLSTIRRFESGVNVGLEVVVRVALALRAEDELAELFPEPELRTLDDILKKNRKRQRARKRP